MLPFFPDAPDRGEQCFDLQYSLCFSYGTYHGLSFFRTVLSLFSSLLSEGKDNIFTVRNPVDVTYGSSPVYC